MANPRIDELRRRLEREPGSRLFGQLAEELRKEGDLTEAIRVARAGLTAHPNYPSARMTLGRALFDTGDLAAARGELEHVLRGAPDNILASRMLAECLEGLGDLGAALLQFRAALRLAPGDRPTELQIKALEQRLGAPGGTHPGPPPAPPRPPSPPPPPEAGRPKEAPLAPPPSAGPAPARPAVAPPPLPAPRARGAPPPRPAADPVMARPPLPPPAPDPAPDFDDVFETAPSWQRLASPVTPAASEDILLLEDEAPTLPAAAPFAPPRPAEARPVPPPAPGPEPAWQATLPAAVPPPLADAGKPEAHHVAPREAPVTLAFDRAPAIEEELSFDATLAPSADPARTLSGTPAFGTMAPAHPLAGSAAAGHAAPPPAAPSVETAPPTDTTAAFAAFSAAIPPPSHIPEAEPRPTGPLPSALPAQAAPGAPPAAPGAPEGDVAAEAPALSTSTLAELYFDQGFFDKSIQVYEELLEREPQNERARARLIEIKTHSRRLAEATENDPRAARRRALERKIARLEEMLAAVRRG